jgi:hypothetical protein
MQAVVPGGTRESELLDDITRRGLEFYESQLRSGLEQDHPGEIVAIHPDSGEYSVAPHEDDAVARLRSRQPTGLLFVRRIGPPTPADQRLAARFAGGFPRK